MKNILIAAGIFALFGLVGSCSAVGTYNSLTSQEKGVTATWRNSQVWYDTFWKKVSETAQVTDKYKSDFKEIFIGGIEGRYPPGKAVTFLMESNPALDASVYVQVQRVIESGRNDFAQTQQTLVDRQRAYDTSLHTFPNVILAGVFGFPSEINGQDRPATDVDGDGRYTVLDYPTVTSAKTQEVFKTGREDKPLDVFGGAK